MNRKFSSSLVSRFAASTAALASGLVLLSVAYFVFVNWSFLQGSFDATLRGYGATMAEAIRKDPALAPEIAKRHSIGIVLETPDGQVAYGSDGNPVDPGTYDRPGFRRVDAVSHDSRRVSFYWDRSVLAKSHTSLLAGLIVMLLVMIGVTYAFQLKQLSPLRSLTAGVEAVSRGDFSTRVPVVRRDEIGQAAEAFNNMTKRIEEMIEDRERLLADVSHELRSPLARIKVALELIPEDEKRDSIARDVREMESLTNALLERERVRTELDERRGEEVDLAEIANDVAAAVGDRAPGMSVTSDGESLRLRADARMLRVLIQNLVDNALKFSLPDSHRVELVLIAGNDTIELQVLDDGKGIPGADRDRVFEPFVKLDPSRGHHSGYGLGLNLCRRIVDAHGGSIRIDDNPNGRGTRVIVSIPRA